MYFKQQPGSCQHLVLKTKLEVQYLGHDSWERQYLFLDKNAPNQTLRSLESQI